MRITVALTPRLLRAPANSAVAVVDVLRASSSLVMMFARGLLRAIVAANLRDARALALRNFSMLCGEVKSQPPAGFDYGNSPAQFAALSLSGKSAVLMTTNGTRAIALPPARGSLPLRRWSSAAPAPPGCWRRRAGASWT